jgi:hypothetical protein
VRLWGLFSRKSGRDGSCTSQQHLRRRGAWRRRQLRPCPSGALFFASALIRLSQWTSFSPFPCPPAHKHTHNSSLNLSHRQSSLEDMILNVSATSHLTMFDETALCAPAFRVLKVCNLDIAENQGLVHTWVNEVVVHSNESADQQVLSLQCSLY